MKIFHCGKMASEINRVCVLLSTFNGELYLEEQLSSLANQTFSEFDIIARDDGSSDDTISILQSAGVEVVCGDENIGPQLSFIKLVQAALEKPYYNYFLFCDQDDIWCDTKIETLLKAVRSSYPYQTKPVLAFSDLIVVNYRNEEIAPSFLKLQQLDPSRVSLNQLLTQNVVTGCATLFNREMATLISSINKDVLMHDWASAILASLYGELLFVDQPLVRYRQHNNNTIGVKKNELFDYYQLLKKLLAGEHRPLNNNIKQALVIYDHLDKSRVDGNKLQALQAFISLKEQPSIKKTYLVLKFGFLKHGLVRNLAMIIGFLFEKK